MNQKKELKQYEQLTLADDFIFCKVFTTHHELLKKLIEMITGEEIDGFVEINNQKSIKQTIDGKGIRCDVYAVESGRKIVYDIEMQTTKKRDLPRRARYYQSTIDSANLERGEDYAEIPNSYVVFLCTDPLFDGVDQLFCYEKRNFRHPYQSMDDGTKTIFLTTKGHDRTLPKEVKEFLDYLDQGKLTSDFTKELEKAVFDAKQNRIWKEEFIMKSLIEMDAHYAGRNEGLAEGKAEGIAEGRNNTVYEFVSNGLISPEAGAKELQISVKELKRRMKESGFNFVENGR